MTVAELEDRMTSAEFTRWMAHDKVAHDERELARMAEKAQKKVMGQK